MIEIIFYGTSKRASTLQRKVRSLESYALVRSIKYTYSGICFFRANFCSLRTTNIISTVERFGWEPLCSSGRIPTRSQYPLRRRARIFSSILPACATSKIPLVVAALCPILIFVEYHDDSIFPLLCCGTFSPLQIQTKKISSRLRRRAGGWGKSSTAQRKLLRFPQPFRLSDPASWAERLAAYFRATGQGLRRCSGRALLTLRWGEFGTTIPIVRG